MGSRCKKTMMCDPRRYGLVVRWTGGWENGFIEKKKGNGPRRRYGDPPLPEQSLPEQSLPEQSLPEQSLPEQLRLGLGVRS